MIVADVLPRTSTRENLSGAKKSAPRWSAICTGLSSEHGAGAPTDGTSLPGANQIVKQSKSEPGFPFSPPEDRLSLCDALATLHVAIAFGTDYTKV